MGAAMLEGWLAGSMLAAGAHLVEPNAAAVAGFRDRKGVACHARIEDLPADLAPEIVVLAVKPQTMAAVLPLLARFKAATFLSIAAGKRIAGLSAGLGGAAGREREVMAMYGQLADRLSETPFALKGLVQDARGEWSGTTVRGVTLRFGRVSPLDQVPRLKTTVLTALQPRLDRVKSIDLRYANGFAVAWRDPAAGTPASETIAEPSTDARTVTPAPGVTP